MAGRPRPFLRPSTARGIGIVLWIVGGLMLLDDQRRRSRR